MSRPRFLADNDLNQNIIDGVLRREPLIEFLRARDVGMARHRDPQVLSYTANEGLILVSHDVNTMPMHAHSRMAQGERMTGLFMIRQTEPIRAVIDDLVLVWSASEAEEWQNIVSFLPL